jgi:hypothetical protein
MRPYRTVLIDLFHQLHAREQQPFRRNGRLDVRFRHRITSRSMAEMRSQAVMPRSA